MTAFLDTTTIGVSDSGADSSAAKDLAKIARAELERCGWNIAKALPAVLAIVKDDDVLLEEMVREYLQHEEQDRRIKRRKAIWAASLEVDKSQRGNRVKALANGNALMLLDWPLRSGKPLKDATKAEVRADAEFFYH